MIRKRNSLIESAKYKSGSHVEQSPLLVSVVVPAYNCESYIGATLHSLTVQTYSDIEIIVVDDGSVDHTAQIVESFMRNDNRIKLIKQPNAGVAVARNRGIQAATGQFIAPVDSDDICYPKKIEKLLACMLNSSNNVGLVYGWSAIVDNKGMCTGGYSAGLVEGDVFVELVCTNFIGNASACLIRKDCFDLVGFYNPDFIANKAQGCEDYDLYLRLAEHFKFKVVKEFLTGYRKTDKSMSCDYHTMEKSLRLVFKDLKRRNSWMPNVALRRAHGSNCFWLSSHASYVGSFKGSFSYLLKVALNDPAFLTNTIYIYNLFYALWKACGMPFRPFFFHHKKRLLRAGISDEKVKKEITLENLIEQAKRPNSSSSLMLFRARRRKTVCRMIRESRNANLIEKRSENYRLDEKS